MRKCNANSNTADVSAVCLSAARALGAAYLSVRDTHGRRANYRSRENVPATFRLLLELREQR